jgi:triphosphoribosyl-dephospho-CoA synthase
MSTAIAAAFKQACLDELSALKSGNVHIFADGHGMVVQDFMQSAEAASRVIATPEFTVGQRIQAAIQATWEAVSCNTNLGIVLLAAPLLQAALKPKTAPYREQLQAVLHALTQQDAALAYQAIQQASPAGLGQVAAHDVQQVPQITLLQAMQAAQSYDTIALQYATDFAAVFDVGLAIFNATLQRWERPAWATTAVYLAFLSHFADSHIARKFGTELALQIQQEAQDHYQAFIALDNPKLYMPSLLQWDASLKARGINPGTSADLTVASLLLVHLQVS